MASPLALAEALRKYKAVTNQLQWSVEEARAEVDANEKRCKDLLAQHHAAWVADREREAIRHAEEIALLRDLHAQQLRRLAAAAPEAFDRAAQAERY